MHPFVALARSGDLARLEAGEIPPRIGDFVSSVTDPRLCGFVDRVIKNKRLTIYMVRLSNRRIVSIPANDIRFIAPFETDLDDEDIS